MVKAEKPCCKQSLSDENNILKKSIHLLLSCLVDIHPLTLSPLLTSLFGKKRSHDTVSMKNLGCGYEDTVREHRISRQTTKSRHFQHTKSTDNQHYECFLSFMFPLGSGGSGSSWYHHWDLTVRSSMTTIITATAAAWNRFMQIFKTCTLLVHSIQF